MTGLRPRVADRARAAMFLSDLVESAPELAKLLAGELREDSTARSIVLTHPSSNLAPSVPASPRGWQALSSRKDCPCCWRFVRASEPSSPGHVLMMLWRCCPRLCDGARRPALPACYGAGCSCSCRPCSCWVAPSSDRSTAPGWPSGLECSSLL